MKTLTKLIDIAFKTHASMWEAGYSKAVIDIERAMNKALRDIKFKNK